MRTVPIRPSLRPQASLLPAVRPRPLHAPPEPRQGGAPAADLARLTALLIDADASLPPLVAALLREALGPRAQLEHERTGAAGFRRAAELRPELILLDLRLPGLDGLTVLRLLKADPELAPIPVVILTAHADTLMLGMALDAGAVGHVFKPIDGPRFSKEVRAALGL